MIDQVLFALKDFPKKKKVKIPPRLVLIKNKTGNRELILFSLFSLFFIYNYLQSEYFVSVCVCV